MIVACIESILIVKNIVEATGKSAVICVAIMHCIACQATVIAALF